MADSPISSLPAVENLSNGQPNIEADDLFVLEHINDGQKKACKVSGDQVTKFVNRNVVAYDGSIVASDAAGGANYDPNTEKLTLVLPHGAGIAEVIQKPSTVENDRVVDWYALKTEDAQYTGTKELGKELTPWIKVTNGKDGQGTVNSVMGIGPGGSPPNPFNASLDVPKSVLMDYIHPVGSIYMTQLPISPASIFGGTWVLIHDKFLLAAGSSYAIDTFGGSATKSVSVEGQADVGMYDYNDQGTTRTYIQFNSKSASGTTLKFNTPTEYNRFERAATYNYTGSDQSNATHVSASGSVNVMPPYRTVYVWLRTSPDYADYDKETIAGKYVPNGAAVGTQMDIFDYKVASSAVYNTLLIACSEGDEFTVTGSGATSTTGGHVWGFMTEAGVVLSRSTTATVTDAVITAPADTAFLIVNWKDAEPFSLVGGDATGE